MIGPFLSIKTVVKSINKWLKMIGRRKRNNNYGVNCFLLKILIPSKIKKPLLKCSNKFILLKSRRNSFHQSKSLIFRHSHN